MRRVLGKSFFNRPTLEVAEELLGKFLVRRIERRKIEGTCPERARRIEGLITEVEAYVGPEDRASHASRGRTKRTEIMFGPPGSWYVYLVYGMHYCLNIVTEQEGRPAAILIRSVAVPAELAPHPKHSHILQNVRMSAVNIKGPGKVCRYFAIDRGFNALPAAKKTGLWIEDRGITINPRGIERGKRIGVEYAGKWKDKPWRFFISEEMIAAPY